MHDAATGVAAGAAQQAVLNSVAVAEIPMLLPGTSKDLGSYKVELPPQTEPKKVKVKAKLTLHGTFVVENAQLIEEEPSGSLFWVVFSHVPLSLTG